MKSKRIWIVLPGVVGALAYAGTALGTPPSKVTTTTYGVGHFDAINTMTRTDLPVGATPDFWQGQISTNSSSDLYVLENTIAPGGTFGWHSHPGPRLVIVKSGTATFYLANDPTCSPQVVPTGSGFVDQGGDAHVVRNEGNVDLVTVVVSLVPAGQERRIDQLAPENCGVI